MNDMNQNIAMPEEKKKIPGGLNVLTILTFIGCGLQALNAIWSCVGAKSGLDKMEDMINSGKVDQLPSFLRKMFTPEMVEMARKAYENRIPILLISLIAVTLCLVGAIQMRKLKMQGYYLWLIGELIPFVSIIAFVGTKLLGTLQVEISIGVTLLFIILYSVQRKHLS